MLPKSLTAKTVAGLAPNGAPRNDGDSERALACGSLAAGAMKILAERTTLRRALLLAERLAERLEQGPVDRIALRVVFGVPLHAERKGSRVRNANGLDRPVLRHALHHHAFAGREDALTMQRVHADRVAAEQFGKRPAGQ